MCADFDAQLPVRSTALEFTTEVANAAGTTINPAEDYAQGSTTSGENGVLDQGAVTTAAPTYISGTTNPLSLDTSGNLRVTFAGSSEQNVNLNQVGGAAIALGQTTMSASIPVTIASNQSTLNINEAQINGVALGSPSTYGTSPGAVSVQGVNAYITNTVPVTLTSTTITGTVAVTQSTSPWVVSLASTTITGTVTAVGNLTNNNAAPAANNIGVLPAVAAAAAPTWTTGDQVLLSEDLSGNLRVITGSGSTTAVTGTVAVTESGTWNITNITGTISLPTGAATSALQTTGNTSLATIATNITGLTVAQGSTTAGENGQLTLGAVTTAAPTYVTGTSNALSLTTAGSLRTQDASDGPVAAGTAALFSQLVGAQYNTVLPTLTNGQQSALQMDSNGRLLVDISSSPEQNVNLNQVGGAAIALGQTTMSASIPVTIASNQSAIPVTLTSTTITGTVAVTQSTSPWVVSGTVTTTPPANASTNITQWDSVALGAPSAYGTAPGAVTVPGVNAFITNTVPVTGTFWQATQPVSGTVTSNQGTPNTVANSWPVEITDGTNVLGTPAHPVNVTFANGTPVVTYATTAAVASNASATQSVAGPINLDQVHVSASGEVKVVIAIGVTGSEATKWVGFTSAADKNFDWVLPETYVIPSGSDVKITITNKDTAAMDIYSSVINH
jgi:hypothetical protein